MKKALKEKIEKLVKYAKDNKKVFVFGCEVYTPEEARDAMMSHAEEDMENKSQSLDEWEDDTRECLADAPRINDEEIAKDYQEIKKECGSDETVEICFREENGIIHFSGHSWKKGSCYSVDDLRRNGDFELQYNPNGDLQAVGSEVELTDDEAQELYDATHEKI